MERRSLLKLFGSSALAGALQSPYSGLAIENCHHEFETEGEFETGIDSVDDYIGRIGPGDVLAIGGHVLSGKTSFALTIANHICRFHEKDVIYWGPHIDQDARLATAIQAFSQERAGTLYLRCMHEALGGLSSSSIDLGLLIVDDFEFHLASHDSNWHLNGKLLEKKLGELKWFAAQNHCLVLPLMTIRRCDKYPRDPPRSAWPEISDLGLLGREIQKIGKIALLCRPALYSSDFGGSWKKCTSFTMPRQCLRVSDEGIMSQLLMNEGTGLFRDITEEEAQSCFGQYTEV